MRFKVFKKCEECKKKTKSLIFYKGKFLCHDCHRSKTNIIPNNLPRIFDEPLDTHLIINLMLTKSQNQKLEKRLNFLFPKMNHKNGRNGVSQYARSLILNDLENWKEI